MSATADRPVSYAIQHHSSNPPAVTLKSAGVAPTPQNGAANKMYPPPEATHAEVLSDKALFQKTLEKLLAHLDIKLKVPKVGGVEVDLHLLYKEVTAIGGLEVVITRKQWVVVCDPFNFPASFTNKSFVIKKLYVNMLHHYEQVYLHRTQGPIIPPPAGPPDTSCNVVPKLEPIKRKEFESAPARPAVPVVPTRLATLGSLLPGAPGTSQGAAMLASRGLPIGTKFTGSVDQNLESGYLITINVAGQQLQGILYKQPPAQASNVIRPGDPQQQAHTLAGEDYADYDSSEAKRTRLNKESCTATTTPSHPLQPPLPPRSAFSYFMASLPRERLFAMHPGADSEMLAHIVSDMWQQLSPEQRAPFIEHFIRDKERYDMQMEEFQMQLRAHQARAHLAEPGCSSDDGDTHVGPVPHPHYVHGLHAMPMYRPQHAATAHMTSASHSQLPPHPGYMMMPGHGAMAPHDPMAYAAAFYSDEDMPYDEEHDEQFHSPNGTPLAYSPLHHPGMAHGMHHAPMPQAMMHYPPAKSHMYLTSTGAMPGSHDDFARAHLASTDMVDATCQVTTGAAAAAAFSGQPRNDLVQAVEMDAHYSDEDLAAVVQELSEGAPPSSTASQSEVPLPAHFTDGFAAPFFGHQNRFEGQLLKREVVHTA